MLKSGLLFSLLLTASIATASSDNISDTNRMLDQARPHSIKIVNRLLDRPVDLEATLTRIELLKAKEKKRVRGEKFMAAFEGEQISAIWIRNYAASTKSVTLLETILLRINPGDNLEISVDQWPSFISGIKLSADDIFLDNTTQDGEFSVEIVENDPNLKARYPRSFVGDPKDLDLHRALYKKYFLAAQDIEGEDIWKDFASQPSGVTADKRDEEVIISLTSYPARFDTTWLAIESLLRQEEKPDRIVLNLFEDEFPGRVLPWFIQQQMRRGLEINWNAENLKVYLKVIPTIQKYPNAAVVAVDDDVIYPTNRLKNLIAGYKQHPDCVIASDVRVVKTFENYILPVSAWQFTGWRPSSPAFDSPFTDGIPEGVWGILTPPNTLYKDFARKDLFFKLCPSDDDLWMYAMVVLGGKKIFKIARDNQPLVNVDGSQEVDSTLWKTNIVNRGEKVTQCFAAVYNHYNFEKFFAGKIAAADVTDLKKIRDRSLMQHNKMLRITDIDGDLSLPLDLVKSFGWTEPYGSWSLSENAEFRVYRPDSKQSLVKIVLDGDPYVNPRTGAARLSIKKSGQEEELFSTTFSNRGARKVSFFNVFSEGEEVFNLNTPDFLRPDDEGFGTYFRELGFYLLQFGVFEVSHTVNPMPLGKGFDPKSPISLDEGFYGAEEEGIWSSAKGTFTVAFPKAAKEYKLDIDYRPFTLAGNPRLDFRLLDESRVVFTGISEYGKDQSAFSFTYTPESIMSRLTLEVDQAKSPLSLGLGGDERVLGMFLKNIRIVEQ